MSWSVEKLSSLCDIFTDGDWVESKDQSPEGVRLIQTGNVGEGVFKDRRDKGRFISIDTFNRLNCTEIFEGDCLVSRLPDPVGRSCLIPKTNDRMITAVDCTIIRLNKSQLLSEFFSYFTQSCSYLASVESLTSGATRKRISRKNLGEVSIPFPPIPEQQRIVAILDQAFADIEKARANAEQNLKNARELFDSHAQNIFSQKKDGWREKTLGELGKVSMCKRILKKQTSVAGDIPFYKIGTFGKTANAFIDADLYEEYKTRFSFPKVGDILISASGTIGRCVVYDGVPAYFQDSNIVWIDNSESLVLNEYLFHFYRVCDWNPSKGATISRLYNDDLRKIKIAFPSISEQQRLSKDIADLHKQNTSLQRIYEEKLKSLDELKKSLLQKAFTGELTKNKGMAA